MPVPYDTHMEVSMNYFKTGLLLVILTMLFVFIGGYFGGQQGAVYAFIFAFIMNMISYWFSDKIVLMMYKAKEANVNEVPEIYSIVKDLTITDKMPMPKVY